ncbi:MAG: TfoX/Sxy family protein [Myxococcota bacterium]
MAYDEGLAERVSEMLDDGDIRHQVKKMFGGICYLINGNMAAGIIGDDLIVRVGPDGYKAAMARPHTRKFDFTGRAMKGWVVVGSEGLDEDGPLKSWIDCGVGFAKSLPKK